MTGEGHRETASQDEGCGVLQFPYVITGLVPVIRSVRRSAHPVVRRRLSHVITSHVITGLVPVISIMWGAAPHHRDGRDRPGHDEQRLGQEEASLWTMFLVCS